MGFCFRYFLSSCFPISKLQHGLRKTGYSLWKQPQLHSPLPPSAMLIHNGRRQQIQGRLVSQGTSARGRSKSSVKQGWYKLGKRHYGKEMHSLQMEKVPPLVSFRSRSCHSSALEAGRPALHSYFGYIPVHVILLECQFIPANQATRSAWISLTYLSTYCARMSNMKVQNRMSKLLSTEVIGSCNLLP